MSDTLTLNPRIDYMEQGRKPPLYTPDSTKNLNPMQSNPYLEEGRGYYSMNRPESPYPSSHSTLMNQNPNPTVWEKVKKTFGLGGKRRLRRLKTLKIKKMGKSRKSRKSRRKPFRKSKKYKKSKNSKEGVVGGMYIPLHGGASIVVNPYSPPMDFAQVKDIPTAKPHNMVG